MIGIVKTAATLVIEVGTDMVIHSVVRRNLPRHMGKAAKTLATIGTLAMADAVTKATMDRVEDTIDMVAATVDVTVDHVKNTVKKG